MNQRNYRKPAIVLLASTFVMLAAEEIDGAYFKQSTTVNSRSNSKYWD